jgi:hypothetical protein
MLSTFYVYSISIHVLVTGRLGLCISYLYFVLFLPQIRRQLKPVHLLVIVKTQTAPVATIWSALVVNAHA